MTTKQWMARALMVASVTGVSGLSAWGQAQAPLPVPAIPATPPVPMVEVYYGTQKVSPPAEAPVVAETPAPVVAAPKVEEKPAPPPRVEQPPVFIMPAAAWSTGHAPMMPGREELATDVGSPLMRMLALGMNRLVLASMPQHVSNPQTPNIVIIRESAREPMPAPVAAPATPTPPQIVVVREPAPEPKPMMPETPPGVRVTPETAVAAGACVICLMGLMAMWIRSGRSTAAATPVMAGLPNVAIPHNPETDGPLLMGKYRVGQTPESAEKFDIGPTFTEEKQVQQQKEEAGKQAVVADLLAKNLAMMTEMQNSVLTSTDPEFDVSTPVQV